jgi:hypothetical protein
MSPADRHPHTGMTLYGMEVKAYVDAEKLIVIWMWTL